MVGWYRKTSPLRRSLDEGKRYRISSRLYELHRSLMYELGTRPMDTSFMIYLYQMGRMIAVRGGQCRTTQLTTLVEHLNGIYRRNRVVDETGYWSVHVATASQIVVLRRQKLRMVSIMRAWIRTSLVRWIEMQTETFRAAGFADGTYVVLFKLIGIIPESD